MLIKRKVLEGIASGDVTLAFRRWKRATVKPGGTLMTAVGVLAVESVETVTLKSITLSEAKRAGFASRSALIDELKGREGKVHKIGLTLAHEDPRIALRKEKISPGEAAKLVARIAWARRYLELIRDRPGVRAIELASQLGIEKKPFKQRVRKLKTLGLTESLKVGYRLSPRGSSLLDLTS
ncbi:MAG: hypothetical protein AAGF12_16335 [Myxococcota bacterium]